MPTKNNPERLYNILTLVLFVLALWYMLPTARASEFAPLQLVKMPVPQGPTCEEVAQMYVGNKREIEMEKCNQLSEVVTDLSDSEMVPFDGV